MKDYRLENLGCVNCGKVHEMKVFVNKEQNYDYETAVCPKCGTSGSAENERSER